MNKKEIREKKIAIRKVVCEEIVWKNSKKIFEKICSLKEFKKAKKIMFYLPFQNEVDTKKMIEKAFKLHKEVFFPKIIKDRVVAIKVKNLSNLVQGKYGILEPETKVYNSKAVDFLDVVIVPGVVFDKKCNRVGFGKGYFDKFLKKNKNSKKVGLAHSFQIVDNISVSKRDVPMDIVITEKQIFIRHHGY
ncbi:MAG: 5-formyltetrahydrofolate cyclo-ligase [Elusimicrobia bacterium RIFOXYD2_FULL_34_15]|nr:MAG: 5-formyltetrahydrofolate cyclo-ligase [Elusimicrobia bacterium RIFOXYD2_FULL_34_15]